jgi:type III secretory pathway component EscS
MATARQEADQDWQEAGQAEMTGLHWLALLHSLWPIVVACAVSFLAGVVITVILLVDGQAK